MYDKFLRAGIQVVGVRDSPWPKYPNGRTLDTPICLQKGGNAQTCGTPRARVLSPTDPAAPMAKARRNFHQIDLTRGICTATFCPAIVGNIIVYKDWHHLSASYIRSPPTNSETGWVRHCAGGRYADHQAAGLKRKSRGDLHEQVGQVGRPGQEG